MHFYASKAVWSVWGLYGYVVPAVGAVISPSGPLRLSILAVPHLLGGVEGAPCRISC